MNTITGNSGGTPQKLLGVYADGARDRVLISTLVFNAQVSGTVIAMQRLPLPAIITGIMVMTDTSTGSATLAIGNANSANYYAAAQAYTATNTPTNVGLVASTGVLITQGYDALSGNAVTYQAPGQGGANYDDILITTAAATLPGSGNLTIIFRFAID